MPNLPLEDLAHVVLSGSLSTEEWSTGAWFKLTGVGTFTPSDLDAATAAMVTPAGTFWTNALKGMNASGLSFTQLKMWFYRNAVLAGISTQAISASAASGTAPQPGYVAQVVTLRSDNPSRSGRGRMYLPKTGVAPSASTFQWSSISSQLSALKTFLQACETALETMPGTSVVAGLCVVGRTGLASQPVTKLTADSIPDTQHGRTRHLVAAVNDQLAY